MPVRKSPAKDAIVQAFSMGNPFSFAWAAEMWGYGFIGLATWFVSPFFRKGGIEMAAKVLFILNGILSISGALYTSADPGWVLTTAGYVSFGLWNILYLLMAMITIKVLNLRKNDPVENS